MCLAACNAIFALSKCLHQGTNLGKSVSWGYLWNCWEYLSETQLQVSDSARQGAQPAPRGVNVQEQNSIPCWYWILTCSSSWIYETSYYLKFVSFPLPFSPYLFFSTTKDIFKTHLLSKIRGFSRNSEKKITTLWPLCVSKAGAKIPDALKEVRGQIWRLLTEENWCPG